MNHVECYFFVSPFSPFWKVESSAPEVIELYKLLIVEDEEIFRRVLPNIIDWNSIGFEVAGVCENGFRALEFLDNTEVDVILMDIRMPVLNGLELDRR